LKIAISILCFKPNTGGQHAHAEQLSQHLQKRGHDVVVVARAATRVPRGRDYLFFNEPDSILTVNGVPVRPLKFSRIWLPVLWFIPNTKQITSTKSHFDALSTWLAMA